MLTSSNFPFAAVLWDMDGTLVDSEPIWMEEESALMRSLGADWSDFDAKYCLGGPIERVDAYMRQRAGDVHAPYELSNLLINRMVDRLASDTSFVPGARELIDELHALPVPMALVSASTRSIMDAALKSIGGHYFKITISHDDVAQTKPDPEGYLAAAAAIGVPIEEVLIIEDSITGMNAAIDSGAYVLGLTHMVELPRSARTLHRESLHGLDARALGRLFQAIMV